VWGAGLSAAPLRLATSPTQEYLLVDPRRRNKMGHDAQVLRYWVEMYSSGALMLRLKWALRAEWSDWCNRPVRSHGRRLPVGSG
jgi:hypothetical protein